MPTIAVTMPLKYYLRVEHAVTVPYAHVCQEQPLPELQGCDVEITFLRGSEPEEGSILEGGAPRSAIRIQITAEENFEDATVNRFAISNCREIINRIILAYQATTGEWSNAGFISPVGTSDMQLFAEIMVDGEEFRDRWPTESFSTIPLEQGQASEFERYFIGEEDLSLPILFVTTAVSSLEQGQYAMAVLLAATTVELRTTQAVSARLRDAGWSEPAIQTYERLTLGGKLQIPPTDPRSLATYFDGVDGFSDLLGRARDELVGLRNDVAHRGYLPPHQSAIDSVEIARSFLHLTG